MILNQVEQNQKGEPIQGPAVGQNIQYLDVEQQQQKAAPQVVEYRVPPRKCCCCTLSKKCALISCCSISILVAISLGLAYYFLVAVGPYCRPLAGEWNGEPFESLTIQGGASVSVLTGDKWTVTGAAAIDSRGQGDLSAVKFVYDERHKKVCVTVPNPQECTYPSRFCNYDITVPSNKFASLGVFSSGSIIMNVPIEYNDKFKAIVKSSGSISMDSVSAKEVEAKVASSGYITFKNIQASKAHTEVSSSGSITGESGHINKFEGKVTASGGINFLNVSIGSGKGKCKASGNINVPSSVSLHGCD